MLDQNNGFLLIAEEIPPPDVYSNIKPCIHLKEKLDSASRNKFFESYRKAVLISKEVMYDGQDKFRNESKSISRERIKELESRVLKCSDCQLNNFLHNFVCMNCDHVGCFEGRNHSYSHSNESGHLISVDCCNGLLYCFLCGNYVNNPSVNSVRQQMLHNRNYISINEEEINRNYKEPPKDAQLGRKGFVNLGSTCFMSCVLQTLIQNPLVKYQFFNDDVHFFNCQCNQDYASSNTISEENACITCSIDNIFKNFYAVEDSDAYGMTNFLITTWYKKKAFSGTQEQDAHEFWQFLLNEFHLDYMRVTGLVDESKCKCLTHSTFSCELESSIKCSICGSVTSTIDPMIDLSLEINQTEETTPSLYDCLDLFTSDEKLDSIYTCQKCNRKNHATKALKIHKWPRVLAIQLKRFKHNVNQETFSKINSFVELPLVLDLSKYSSATDSMQYDCFYEIFAMICHVGSVNTGHYITVIKSGTGQWLKFDDCVITLLKPTEVAHLNAYLIFYISHTL